MAAQHTRFRDPLTLAEVVQLIAADEFLLPGIQRAFVWKPDQISKLFDSLMRGFPIGPVLVWETTPRDHKNLRFRRLTTDYAGTATPLSSQPRSAGRVLAVLDGQQRLTAINIGLRGTHSTSASSPRQLCLNLDAVNEEPNAEEDMYAFRFRPTNADLGDEWFPVAQALHLRTAVASLSEALDDVGIAATPGRIDVLRQLVATVNGRPCVRVDSEPNADLDRVLNIFARVNTGGTQLSYVDLMVSTIATQWTALDPTTEFHLLRSTINKIGVEGFRFSFDRIVKAGLVLLDTKDPKFHIESFSRGNNAAKLEGEWKRFSGSLEIAVGLLDSFGLSGRTLTAENVVIPVAYYVHHRGLKKTYIHAHSHESDRALVKSFVARTLLRRGFWTGAVDPVLVTARDVIRKHGRAGFPLGRLVDALEQIKPIGVSSDFIEELAVLPYSDRRTLTLLSLLFPSAPAAGSSFDKDHVFPTSAFKAGALAQAKLQSSQADRFLDRANQLPNLQLLDKSDNRNGKGASAPKAWLASLSPTTRRKYAAQFVKHLPEGLDGCDAFWDRREDRLRAKIRDLLKPEYDGY